MVDDPTRETVVFHVENISNDPVTLRVVKSARGIEPITPTVRLEPHAVGSLRVHVTIRKSGRFNKQLTVRTDKGGHYTLFIKGRAIQRNKQPQDCPDLTGSVRYTPPQYSLRVRVLDRTTGHAIRRAAVQVEGGKQITGITDEEGFYKKTLPIGQYFIRVEKPGYLPADTFSYVNASIRLMEIYLQPLQSSKAPPPQPAPSPTPQKVTAPRPREINILVKDSITQLPIKSAAIAIWQGKNYLGKWYSSKDGQIHLQLLPYPHQLKIRHTNYPPKEQLLVIDSIQSHYTIWLSSTSSTASNTMEPPPMSTSSSLSHPYRLQVIDPNGHPIPDIRIHIYSNNRYRGRYAISSRGTPLTWYAQPGTYYLKLYDPASRYQWDTTVTLPAIPSLIKVIAPTNSAHHTSPSHSQPDSILPLPQPPAPFSSDTARMILPPELYRTNNIVFLVDVSSSMKQKMPHLRQALFQLIQALRPDDRISVITYATAAHVVTRGVSGDAKDSLHKVAEHLRAGGMTYGIRGLRKAYELANEYYVADGNNQVILITDGEFNSPDYSRLELFRLIRDNALIPIKLSVVSLANKESVGRTLQMVALLGRGSYLAPHNNQSLPSVILDEIKKQSRKDR